MTLFGKTLAAIGALSVLLLAAQSADAEKVRKNETWCLETAIGGGDGGGGGTMNICSFETRAQCVASKVAQGDQCDLNPVIAFQEWNKTHRR